MPLIEDRNSTHATDDAPILRLLNHHPQVCGEKNGVAIRIFMFVAIRNSSRTHL